MTEKLVTLWNSLRELNELNYNQTTFDSKFNLNPNEYRLDDLGAIIKKSEFGKNSEFGWNVDHIFPLDKGGTDNIRNLQLLHWKNNELKSNDFPTFSWSVKFDRYSDEIKNIDKPRPRFTYSASFIESLSDLYPEIIKFKSTELELF
jgi:hypothetical protein